MWFSIVWNDKIFWWKIYAGKVIIDEAEIGQTNLLETLIKFNNKSRPKKEEEKEKTNTFDSVSALYAGQE